MTQEKSRLIDKVITITVIITGLGYFIDMFDMFLFNMLRVKSLTDLGFTGDALTQSGLFIANCQWAGLLLGAYLSGVAGDKFGRKTTLFASIILYSLGSIATSFVTDVHAYGLTRFITGLGLAGELGAGLTLITEKLSAGRRGYGVMIFIIMGFVGVLAAALAAELMYWRHAYLLGGVLGMALLATRILLSESSMFEQIAEKNIMRGGLSLIARNPALLKKYICAIFFVAPTVFIPQILWTLSPEIGKSMGILEPIHPPIILGIGYTCVILGDLMAMVLSERLQSRKKATIIFLMFGILVFTKYLFWPASTLIEFYVLNGLIGLTFGIWVIGAVWAAEHFGTNVRATATTTIPNFARGLTILMNLAYGNLKYMGPLNAAGVIGFTIFVLALIGWRGLSETHGKNLDYVERV